MDIHLICQRWCIKQMPPKKLGKQYLWKSPMGGMVNKRKQEAHESFGKLNYSRLALFTFTRGGSLNPIHLQIKNTISIGYLMKMKATHDMGIWSYLLSK